MASISKVNGGGGRPIVALPFAYQEYLDDVKSAKKSMTIEQPYIAPI